MREVEGGMAVCGRALMEGARGMRGRDGCCLDGVLHAAAADDDDGYNGNGYASCDMACTMMDEMDGNECM